MTQLRNLQDLERFALDALGLFFFSLLGRAWDIGRKFLRVPCHCCRVPIDCVGPGPAPTHPTVLVATPGEACPLQLYNHFLQHCNHGQMDFPHRNGCFLVMAVAEWRRCGLLSRCALQGWSHKWVVGERFIGVTHFPWCVGCRERDRSPRPPFTSRNAVGSIC